MNKICLFLLLLLLGCTPKLDKALKVVTKTETNAKAGQQEIFKAFPKVPLNFAAVNFPIKEKTIVVRDTVRTTVTVPGKRIPCPIATGADHKEYHSYVQCPNCVDEQTTIRELETGFQEYRALVEARQERINELEAKHNMRLAAINKERNENEVIKARNRTLENRLNWIYIVAGGLVLLTLLFLLYRVSKR